MSVESVLVKLASDAPVAVAMIVIVFVFLRHLSQRDAMIERVETRCSDALTKNAAALEGLKSAMAENTASLTRYLGGSNHSA